MVNTLSELFFNVSLSQSPFPFSHVLEFHERHLHPQYMKYGLLVTEMFFSKIFKKLIGSLDQF